MRLGPGASVDAEVSKTYDANGTLVATGVMSNGVTVYNDLVHSRSYEMPAIAIEGFHDWLHDVWTLPDRLVQEGFSDMGQGTLNGKTSLIYETTPSPSTRSSALTEHTDGDRVGQRCSPAAPRDTLHRRCEGQETILIEYRVEDVMPTGPIGPSWSGKGRKTPPTSGRILLRLGLILAAAMIAGVIAGVSLALTGFVTDGGVHLFACAVTVIVLSLLVQGPEDMPYHQGRM